MAGAAARAWVRSRFDRTLAVVWALAGTLAYLNIERAFINLVSIWTFNPDIAVVVVAEMLDVLQGHAIEIDGNLPHTALPVANLYNEWHFSHGCPSSVSDLGNNSN